jgi:hypothetical protein
VGNCLFVDIFSLARIDGTWKIVNKTFVHTGGEQPQRIRPGLGASSV